MTNRQEIFDGLHYNKKFLDTSNDVYSDNVVESKEKCFLTNTAQDFEGVKTFKSQPVLEGVGLKLDNLTISNTGNMAWSNNGLDKVLTATNTSGNTSNISFLNNGNLDINVESGKTTSLKVGGGTRVQCSSATFKLFSCNLDIPLGTGTSTGGIRINGSISTPTFLHTISGTDTFNINAPLTQITGGLNYTGFVSITGTSNLTNTALIYIADTSAGACTLRLTTASAQTGRIFTVIRKDTASVNSLTINVSTNSQTINGAGTNLSTTTPYFCYRIFCDGSGYYVI
ncbi:MAG: hypothetical protein RLZZ392_113 [Pseudomonadota bacterium]|jgi:hypothetical protein